MQSLDLDVKNGIRIQRNALRFPDVSGKLLFTVHLDLGKAVKHLLILPVFQQLFQLVGIFLEAVSNGFGKKGRELSVAG